MHHPISFPVRQWCLLFALLLTGCAQGGAPGQPGSVGGSSSSNPQKTLVISNRGEPPTLAARSLITQGSSLNIPPRFFNANLDLYDVHENSHPQLVEALPRFDTA